jgi:hypothetical protein
MRINGREASPDQNGNRPRDFVRLRPALARDASHGQDTSNMAARLRPAKASALTVSTASFHFADSMKLSGLTGKTKLV